jgi:hypothetical protein
MILIRTGEQSRICVSQQTGLMVKAVVDELVERAKGDQCA